MTQAQIDFIIAFRKWFYANTGRWPSLALLGAFWQEITQVQEETS